MKRTVVHTIAIVCFLPAAAILPCPEELKRLFQQSRGVFIGRRKKDLEKDLENTKGFSVANFLKSDHLPVVCRIKTRREKLDRPPKKILAKGEYRKGGSSRFFNH